MTPVSVTELKEHLQAAHRAVAEAVGVYSDDEFWQKPDNRWSVADVVQHLYLSARPVLRLLTAPPDVWQQWGKTQTPTRTYSQLVDDYRNVLARGVKAPETVSPRAADMDVTREAVLQRLTDTYAALADALAQHTREDLGTYRLPHPAFGFLTYGEMLDFVRLHTQHHIERLPARLG